MSHHEENQSQAPLVVGLDSDEVAGAAKDVEGHGKPGGRHSENVVRVEWLAGFTND